MKTIFDKSTRDELIARIQALSPKSQPQWGKMNLYQMLKHCALWDEWMQGKRKYERRAFLGRIFGRMALKNSLKDDGPMMRNAMTLPELKIPEETGDCECRKTRWITAIEEYAKFSNPGFVHYFFGKMTEEQMGYFAYKHADHHLRQFNG
jgi:hypothetical protein